MNRQSFLRLSLLALALAPSAVIADDRSANQGAVYTADNAASGNNILAFRRAGDGSLSQDGSFATGGSGSGGGLGNQGGVVLSRDGRWLLACNAGSHEISVFAVNGHGLTLTDKVSSEGKRPVSLALHRNLLYVLNAGGGAGESDNVTGFIFFGGQLLHCPNSTRALSAGNTGPAQVSFTSDGEALVVTEKATSVIDTFTVGDDGLIDDHKKFVSPTPTPFGFAVGSESRIFVSEANGGAAGASSVASYQVSEEGDLSAISGSIPTTQSAACWVVLTRNERYAYTSNTGSGTISGYRVNGEGKLQLLRPDGVSGVTGSGSKPIDLALSRDSRFLYSLNSGNGTLSGFRISANGSLQALPTVSGIPAGANGLAAR